LVITRSCDSTSKDEMDAPKYVQPQEMDEILQIQKFKREIEKINKRQ
jgi:hypothetical protein